MGLFTLVCLALVCAVLAQGSGLCAGLLPLPVLAASALVLYVSGCAGALEIGAVLLVLAVPVVLADGWRQGVNPLRAVAAALRSPGFVLFLAGSAVLWLMLSVQQPMFTQWDEFTAWGLAPKMVVERGRFYVADPVNLTASFTYPGTSLVISLFHFGGHFAEWSAMAALDTLFLAALSAATALPKSKWGQSVLLFAAGALLPYFFNPVPVGTYATAYANAMADLPLAFLFGGALCLQYVGAGRGVLLAAPVLALLALTKDIGFAYGMIAVFLIGLDLWLGAEKPGKRAFLAALWRAAVLAGVVLLAFLSWGRYTAAVAPTAQTGASVGSAGLSYGAVLLGGVRQLLGFGREAKFAQIMAAMGGAFFTRRISLLGAGAVTVAAITAVAAAAWLCSAKGAARRRVLAAFCGLAGCFAALYLFHLILYHYNFAELEGLALKDYERYLSPYYQAWFLAMLCLLAQAAAGRLARLIYGGAVAAVLAVFCWRGVPAAGFWSGTNSLYTLRAAVADKAAVANRQLHWGDRVLVLSQGDDATRWYYYKYELNARVINGFGGFYGRLGETADRWDSDFMNLVESENWTLYDYKAVCVADTLVAYMAEKDCDYLLIDRADAYLEREFSRVFDGGLTADMPAALYHFEGEDAAMPFTLAARLESGVTQHGG